MKRISIFVLLCVFVFTMCAGAYAKVKLDDTTEYSSLSAALAAIQADNKSHTISFIEDETFNEALVIPLSVDLVIDGANKTLKGKTEGSDNFNFAFVEGDGKTLTIQNLTIASWCNGDATTTTHYSYPLLLENSFKGTATVKNVTIKEFPREAIRARNGTLIVDGCTITASSEYYYQKGISFTNAKGTIKNTTITGTKGTSDNAWGASCVELGYDDMKSYTAEVTIESGTFDGGTRACTVTNYSADNTIGCNLGTLTIKGGNFTGKKADLRVTNAGKEGFKVGKIVISGGTFSRNPEEVAGVSIDTGYRVVSSDGKFVVVSEAVGKPAEVDETTGTVSYDIDGGTLEQALNNLTDEQKAEVKQLPITDGVTEISNATLKELPKLESLDLSNASGLTTTSIDLSGVSIDNVVMSEKTAVTTLSLDATSNVKNIDAEGCLSLDTLVLNSNTKIEKLNVTGTSLTELDASGCTNLKTLNTKGAKVTSLNVTGCENLTDLDCSAAEEGQGEIASLDLTTCVSLEQLDVSANRLVVLDLTKNTKLTGEKTKLGGQKSAQKFTRALDFNLLGFILNLLGLTTDDKGYAANITSVYAVDEDGTETKAVYEDGTAKFDAAPNSIKYYFDTKFSASAQTEALLAAESEFEMDVTIAGEGTAEEPENQDDTISGNSSSGCELGLGLWSLAALMALAKITKKA